MFPDRTPASPQGRRRPESSLELSRSGERILDGMLEAVGDGRLRGHLGAQRARPRRPLPPGVLRPLHLQGGLLPRRLRRRGRAGRSGSCGWPRPGARDWRGQLRAGLAALLELPRRRAGDRPGADRRGPPGRAARRWTARDAAMARARRVPRPRPSRGGDAAGHTDAAADRAGSDRLRHPRRPPLAPGRGRDGRSFRPLLPRAACSSPSCPTSGPRRRTPRWREREPVSYRARRRSASGCSRRWSGSSPPRATRRRRSAT